MLKVHNEGNPIPKEEQITLFEKFKRGSSAERKLGWGIGLTLVKTMVEAHHGSISLDSDKFDGTTFTVSLPKSP